MPSTRSAGWQPNLFALWGQRPNSPSRDLLPTWREWASDVRGAPITSGNFLAEEAPAETVPALREFLNGS